MGYTTHFTGSVKLSRELTIAEAKEWLEISEDKKNTQETFGIDQYLQWVPSEDLSHLIWDGEEKFYDYVPLLQNMCDWLKDREIDTNGVIYWRGEELCDAGILRVTEGILSVEKFEFGKCNEAQPLTIEGLGRIALEKLANNG